MFGLNDPPPLTPFKDPLQVPTVLRPQPGGSDGWDKLRITMRPAQVRLHSELPVTDVWTYEGSYPGPTVEVRTHQRVRVEWVNALCGALPLTAVVVPSAPDGAPAAQSFPGSAGVAPLATVAALPPWTVVHLHGGANPAASDGWTENAVLPGRSTTDTYDTPQRAAMLWYHDHAMGITRFNVLAGLAGLWVIRDEEETQSGLPHGRHEVPLLLQDRNLELDAGGNLTGRLLHKTEDGTMEFFGPYTLVNGKVWPHLDVEATCYRLRLLNGSNARTYRLRLRDDAGADVTGIARQVGTDGGLLAAPAPLPAGGLILAPAERADLLVDFRALGSRTVVLSNDAIAPFGNGPPPATPAEAWANRLPYPDVMQFRVGQQGKQSLDLRTPLSSFSRMSHDDLGQHEHRLVLLAEDRGPPDMLTLRELLPAALGETSPVVEVVEASAKPGDPPARYVVGATRFEDRVNFFPRLDGGEVWKFINATGDTHPIHVHLVQFQILGRQAFKTDGFDVKANATKPGQPLAFDPAASPPPVDENEQGWKDTVRVNPGEMVLVGMRFAPHTGRYMYHCHVLEHEDTEMMRPFVVLPGPVLDVMGGMGGMGPIPGM